jgi:sugar phosphate isomerase/epimerase
MPPILACHTNSYGPFGGQTAIEQIARAGLEWVEIPIRTAGIGSRWGKPLLDDASSSQDVAELERRLQSLGLRVASATCLAGNPLDPACFERARVKIDLAARLGARVALIDAGPGEELADRERVYDRLRQLGDQAAALEILLCCEMHRGICVNHREMAHVIGEVGHPRVRASFDSGNLLYFNENVHAEVALAKTCHLVKHVRLQDSMGEFGKRYSSALGRGGAVDFLRTLQIMRDCGFGGPFTIAIEGIDGEPELSLDGHHQRVVESVEYLRTLGYCR